jgi:carbonic anhydrase
MTIPMTPRPLAAKPTRCVSGGESASRWRKLSLAAGSIAMVVAGCSSTPSDSSSAEPSSKDGMPTASWSYTGDNGPEAWGELSPDFAACSEGKRQSPIEIKDPTSTKRQPPTFDYTDGTSAVDNNGHSIEATSGPGNSMSVDGTEYSLIRMHFHAPSETVMDGTTYPVEAHFVHQSKAGDLAVFAVLFEEGRDSEGWESFVDQMGLEDEASGIAKITWSQMLPSKTKTVRFDGSLTTPECTEGLNWLVATTPVEVSSDQISEFRGAYDDNARPVQPVNGREVTIDAS